MKMIRKAQFSKARRLAVFRGTLQSSKKSAMVVVAAQLDWLHWIDRLMIDLRVVGGASETMGDTYVHTRTYVFVHASRKKIIIESENIEGETPQADLSGLPTSRQRFVRALYIRTCLYSCLLS